MCALPIFVRVVSRVRTVDEISNAVAATRGGTPITVGQIANVRVGGDLRTGAGSMNGEEAVIGTVLMLIGQNSRVVATEASSKLDQVAKTLPPRSEEHTSELQSLMRISYAVFCLKKKKTQTHIQDK